MKKIDGEIIQQAIEVGAKYISDDGKEFDSQWECEHYEAKLKRDKKEKHFDEIYKSIKANWISLNTADADDDNGMFLKRFESKEEFLDALHTLEYYSKGVSRYTLLKGRYTINNLPDFPAVFIVDYCRTAYEDSCDTEEFIFYEVNDYISLLQEDIATIRAEAANLE